MISLPSLKNFEENMLSHKFVKESESCSVLSDSLQPHGLYSSWDSQARILEWVTFPFSRGSSQPRNRTRVCFIAGRFFNSWAIREACFRWADINRRQRVRTAFGAIQDWSFQATDCNLILCVYNFKNSKFHLRPSLGFSIRQASLIFHATWKLSIVAWKIRLACLMENPKLGLKWNLEFLKL